MQANPAASDPAIQQAMIGIAEDMRRQGHTPHLPTMLQHAVQGDPRFNEGVRRSQEQDEVARARSASVQVSGGGSTAPKGTTDDIGDILDQMIPR